MTVAEELDGVGGAEVWAGICGQDEAIRQLDAASRAPVHAYLLVGPSGSGKRALARGFAARLLSAEAVAAGDVEAAERHVRLARAEQHPDLRMVVPEGMTFRRIDAESLARHASLAPVEGRRKVVVGLGFENMEDEATGYLLKAIEEPSASTVFILLTTEILPELVTIASRCVRIDVRPLSESAIVAHLVDEGIDAAEADAAAHAAGGDLERARTLAVDPRLSLRYRAWRELPSRLDGTGHRAAEAVAELMGMIEEAMVPLQERQTAEAVALAEEIERFGLRGGAKKDLETRHKREARRFRSAELRFGLATLAGTYRTALASTDHPATVADALRRVDDAGLALTRYPNETLLLQSLVAHLPPLS